MTTPRWIGAFEAEAGREPCRTDAARMRLAIRLAAMNVHHGTGGPFGAALFDSRDGRLVAVGVNAVVPRRCSLWHAEIVCLEAAHRRLRTHDLAAAGDFVLAASTEPCAMCLGAVVWSGVRGLLCGSRGLDAETAGFDEGPKPALWPTELRRRGIRVRRDLLRPAAVKVLSAYAASGGLVYNPSR